MLIPLDGLITRDDIANIALSEDLILDDEDRISVLEAMRSIDVQACPGSGKTTLIATKLILLAKTWPLQHQGICVLSHTNVAKDEIIDRLKKSKTLEAQRLLSYPHFIGTIQEFVGKYVAFPLIRSDGTRVKLVDTENCVSLIYANLQRRTRTYIDNRSQYSNVLYDFDLKLEGSTTLINVPTFPNGSDSPSYHDLKAVRERMLAEGYFFYRDIYTFAEKALIENSDVKGALQNRFPCIFLDEMQDTQKFQDEILLQLFPLEEPGLIVQRFGDPDQAIFHGIGGEEPNESFNNKSAADMHCEVHKSHRFDSVLAGKIKPLSFNEIRLETELSDDALAERLRLHSQEGSFEHTVIVFDDDTCERVIDFFAGIVSNQFSDEQKGSRRFFVKAVGAVGNEIDPNVDQLKIGHYWPDYDKAKAKTNFKEGSLIEAVRYCRQLPSIDWANSYKMLADCVLRLLRMADKRDGKGRYFSATSMRESLKAKGEWESFRKSIHLLLNDAHEIDHRFWDDICEILNAVFEFENIPAEATEYMAFAEEDAPIDVAEGERGQGGGLIVSLPENRVRHPDGFRIELSTIHGVKGETHDATLVLETKNHCFDLETMLPYLVGELPNDEHPNQQLPDKPNSRRAFKPNKVFMRQFYVAMSRPKHLLCLAVHSDRISLQQKEALEDGGWRVRDIPRLT